MVFTVTKTFLCCSELRRKDRQRLHPRRAVRCFGTIPTRSMVAHCSRRRPLGPIQASRTLLSSRQPSLAPKALLRVDREKLKSRSRLFSFARDCSPANERNDLQETSGDRRVCAGRRLHAEATEATRGNDSRGAQLSLDRHL